MLDLEENIGVERLNEVPSEVNALHIEVLGSLA